MSSRLVYRADLDGLRAVAVLPVVLFHLGVTILPGGFVGVDVFFVLSGFLITSILAADLDGGMFSLLAFYDRRIRRIVPALALVLAFCALAAPLILFPSDLVKFGSTLVATVLAASNFVFAEPSGYFTPEAELSPLLHTWTLAVEEQFYILFPIALWAIWKWARNWRPWIVWLALALSLGLSVVGVRTMPITTFYLLPMRAWEFLIGSVLALELVPKPSATWQREVGVTLGVSAILTAMACYTRNTDFPGLAALVPCIGTALVIWAGIGGRGRETRLGRLLATSVPVFIGLVSYSLYLWHWPLIAFAKHLTNGRLTPPLQVTLAIAAMGLAVLTWQYVEKPFRAGGWPWPAPRYRVLGAIFVSLAFVTIGSVIGLTHGFPQRMSRLEKELLAATADFSHLRSRCLADGSELATFAETCVLGTSGPPNIIVFADSHGVELSVALGELAEARHSSVRQVTAAGCPPAAGFVPNHRRECTKYVDHMLRALMAVPPATVVVTAYYFDRARGGNAESFWKGLAKTVQNLRNAGHTVVLLGAVPPHPGRVAVPKALARWVFHGGTAEDYRFALDRDAATDIELHLERLAKETGAIQVPLVPYFCPDDRGCQGYKNGTVMYFDDNHISVSGARQIAADLLAPVIWPEYFLTNGIPTNPKLR